MPSHAQSCPVMHSRAQSCTVMLSHAQSCTVMRSHAVRPREFFLFCFFFPREFFLLVTSCFASTQISSPRWRARLLIVVSSQRAYINVYDGFGKKEVAIAQKIVVRNAIMESYLRIAVYRKTEQAGRSFRADGTSSWLRCVFFPYYPFLSTPR